MSADVRSSEPLRKLSVEQMGLARFLQQEQQSSIARTAGAESLPSAPSMVPLPEDDEILNTVKQALGDGFAGVIFSGPPGTSKTEYAARVAFTLADGDPQRVRFVQFHPSFQYEDFIEGFVPNKSGGFEPKSKHFREICDAAISDQLHTYVLVIDEISRCDAARVFGEALTYLESSKRNQDFSLASGTVMSVPQNLVLLATMNPWDRGVDDVDIALERRFAHLDMPPSSQLLRELLESSELIPEDVDALVRFFEAIQKRDNRFLHIGHAYFARVRDRGSLTRLWALQLKHHFHRACRSDEAQFRQVEGLWRQLVEAQIAPKAPDPIGEDHTQAPDTPPE